MNRKFHEMKQMVIGHFWDHGGLIFCSSAVKSTLTIEQGLCVCSWHIAKLTVGTVPNR